MVTSLTFGASSPQQYTFSNLQAFSDNFTDVVAQTVRMPSVSGGFDVYGSGIAPKPVGMVRVTFSLFSSTRSGMTALLDSLKAMQTWGKQKLIYQPTDATEDTRYCWARVNNINVARRPADHTDLIQSVTVVFQVSDPFWLKSTAASETIAASGTSTDVTVTNDGNAIALPVITIAPATGDECNNVEIRRIDGSGNILDAIGYILRVLDTDTLIINCKTSAITINGYDQWSNKNEANTVHPDWIRLMPGDNTIRVIFANSGDAADVTFDYEDTYD